MLFVRPRPQVVALTMMPPDTEVLRDGEHRLVAAGQQTLIAVS